MINLRVDHPVDLQQDASQVLDLDTMTLKARENDLVTGVLGPTDPWVHPDIGIHDLAWRNHFINAINWCNF